MKVKGLRNGSQHLDIRTPRITTSWTAWKAMKKHVHLLLCIPALLVFVSCAGDRIGGGPYEALTMDAIHQFGELREAGRLPGISREEHGHVETEEIPQSKSVEYPVTVVLHVAVAQDQSRLSYTFSKESSQSDWRLLHAWRTKQSGEREDLKLN